MVGRLSGKVYYSSFALTRDQPWMATAISWCNWRKEWRFESVPHHEICRNSPEVEAMVSKAIQREFDSRFRYQRNQQTPGLYMLTLSLKGLLTKMAWLFGLISRYKSFSVLTGLQPIGAEMQLRSWRVRFKSWFGVAGRRRVCWEHRQAVWVLSNE